MQRLLQVLPRLKDRKFGIRDQIGLTRQRTKTKTNERLTLSLLKLAGASTPIALERITSGGDLILRMTPSREGSF